MDEQVANWILEFLLRNQSIDDKIINGVLESLPLSNNDNRLKKTLILRRIESEISTGSLSEKLLEFLETIEELDTYDGKTASDLLKTAYCAVAVDCTVRFLEENVTENAKYFEAVERVWRNRVCVVETLGSEELARWWGDIEAAVWDSSVIEKVLVRNTRSEALRAVRVYLKEDGWVSLGPSFLECVASKVGDKVEALRLDGGGGDKCREVALNKGIQKGQSIIRRKHVAAKSKLPRGAKISHAEDDSEGPTNMVNNVSIRRTDEVQEKTNVASDSLSDAVNAAHDFPQTMGNDDNVHTHSMEKGQEVFHSCRMREFHPDASEAARILSSTKMTDNLNNASAFENQTRPVLRSSPEVTRVREVLKSSARDLRAAVTDPLPEALKTAETLCSTGVATNPDISGENQTRAPEVDLVQKNIETSSIMTRAAVRKSSLEASRAVEDVSTKVATNSTRNEDLLTNQIQPDIQPPVEHTENNLEKVKKGKLIGDDQDHEIHDANSKLENLRKKDKLVGDTQGQPNCKRSLMEPNGTGHTFVWDDSIDEMSGRERVALPSSSKRGKISPLQPYVDKRFARRERKKWTPHEEETLREAVKKFGRRWKFILDCYHDAFSDRTDVDLKDKWRNMSKYST